MRWEWRIGRDFPWSRLFQFRFRHYPANWIEPWDEWALWLGPFVFWVGRWPSEKTS